ncbi:serpin B10 [Tachyglossus aculeatus]|uniref:serpin B10 n=1 Tax=Tachyglossus aculeatus TaxID=9261 RepID=UPI0018F49CC5|nr:serpin B10 [Tachyglossus aculeatus]
MDTLSASNNQFALDLSKRLAESAAGKNVFFSPWSITTSLAMVYLGARGNTATQMAEKLGFSKIGNLYSEFQRLLLEINKPSNAYLLKNISKLYAEKTYPFKGEFLQNVKKYFSADPQSVNFGEAEKVRKEINSWVENQTEGKITDLLPDGSVDSLTKMVLINAIYFKGKWEQKFMIQDTTEKPFKINETTTKPVQMMSMKKTLHILQVEEPPTKIIELHYNNREISMFILLPEDLNGLQELENEITYEKLNYWTCADMMDTDEVQVHLPRFKMEESYDLKSTLISMGMSDPFSPGQADFSGISEGKELFLSHVFHKAFVEVNEEGTEAAAGTGSVLTVRMKNPLIIFNADHPFLFFIRHNPTNNILFLGRFCSP